MSFIRWIFLVFAIIVAQSLWSQDNFTGFWQPQMALNYSVSKGYSHNFSLAARNYIVTDGTLDFGTRQLDVVHFSKLNIQDNQSIALGIQYRFRNMFEDSGNELRLTQQYNFTKRPFVVRFGHRFRAEQRITTAQTIHRFRYRFAVDFPLKGEKLDIGEPYFVGGLENLVSVQKNDSSQYDIRWVGLLGWQLQDGLKLQVGTEYRMEDYTSKELQRVFFILTNIQLSL